MKLKLPERRRFVRLEVPLEITVFRGDHEEKLTTKNISPMGFMLRIGRELEENTLLPFSLKACPDGSPVGIKGKVIWQNRVSLEDGSPFEAGIDICDINDADKNEFLRCICDLLYGSEYKERT
jgi:hypothetical protein